MRLLETGKGTKEWSHAYDFFIALAACNTIVPQVTETSEQTVKLIEYQGESPDEQALVYAAAAYGFVLIERTSGHIVIDVLGERQRFSLLGLHEFDSDRKRMSVIVGCGDKTIKLFVKGADNAMLNVIDKMVDLGKILGASGIEDKLQQGVPEAIESLRQAGIKVWVLTGDKQETAISIGYSCKLLTDDMTQIIINSNSKELCKSSLEDAISTSKKLISTYLGTENTQRDKESQRIPLALIIDGPTLVFILETELEDELYKLGTTCDVVLCCRVAPLQKAGIVALMKKRTTDMTLSIGDGANDVSMIQMADVGIGISGQGGTHKLLWPQILQWHSSDDSTLGDIWILAVVTLVNVHLAMDIFRWKWNMHAIIWGLTILTYLCVIAIDTSPAMPGYRAAMRTLGSKLFWLLLLLIIALAFLPRFLVKTCSEYFYPSDIRIARELEKFGNQNEERSEVPGSPSMSHHQQELH
ncbi:hypothetical protein J5N97_013572 [Dioscorea zingiberensis]|uniref:P-type phospholipid transporter n=1 Tax=Dioscorea zingiberensis TaxID=325984 RepID=A0A9D5CTH8_9LILI|nr:hypothetical protein J5N97_013572 [Dioscorea zingiberensis]